MNRLPKHYWSLSIGHCFQRIIFVLFVWAGTAQFGKGNAAVVEFIKEVDFSISGAEANVGAVTWSPDGREIAVLSPLLRYATLFAVPSGQIVASITDLEGGARAINFAADGRVVIPPYRSDRDGVALWDARTGLHTGVPGPDPTGTVTNQLFDFALDDNRTRLVGLHYVKFGDGMSFRVAVYDAKTWRLLADHAIIATGLAVSPDGRHVAVIQGGMIAIIDTDSGVTVTKFQANFNTVQMLAWSADGARIATGTLAEGFGRDIRTGKFGKLHDDDVLQLWDAASGTRIAASREQIGGGVESLEFSRNGKWLVTTTSDGSCRLWDPTTLSLRQIVATGLHPTTALARFSPDSRRIAVIRTGLAQAILYRAR